MSTTECPAPARAGSPEPGARTGWFAVVAVTLGIFAVVTAEQLPVGLLTGIGDELRVPAGTTGLLITLPGVVAAVAAPLVPLVAGRLDRRRLLGALVVVLVLAHLVAALTNGFALLLASRVLVGVAIGGFWAIAGGLAARLVAPASVGRATSLIFAGVAAANVLGVPVGTLVGELAGWRAAFAALGGFGVLVLAGLLATLPRLPAAEPVRVGALVAQLRNAGVRAGIVATLLLVVGQFCAYTFVSPLLQHSSGIDVGLISSLLLGYGICGVVGNFLVGAAANRALRPTMLVVSAALAAVLALFPLLGTSPAGGVAMLLAWGLAFGGVSVGLQTWIRQAAPHAAEAANALWVSTFNLAIALGALVGGRIVDAASLVTALWVAAVLVALTAGAVLTLRRAPA